MRAGTPGSVKKVELIDEGGTAHEVWAGTDETNCGGYLEVKFAETEYPVKAVKLTTGGKALRGDRRGGAGDGAGGRADADQHLRVRRQRPEDAEDRLAPGRRATSWTA